MSAVLKGAIAAALIAGSSLAGTAPAEAHDQTGIAIAAGIIGLGLGAAIAASDHHDRYNDGYRYDNGSVGYYETAPAYGYSYGYSQPYYSGYGYDRGYYRHDRRWDGWRNHRRDDDDRWDRDDDHWDRDFYRR